MTFRTESRIVISRDVVEVWDYLCDVGRWAEWAPTVLECWTRDGRPLQQGSRIEQRAKGILGSTHRRSEQATALAPPHAMAFAGTMGTSRAQWGMRLEPVETAGCDALMWVEVDLAGAMRAIPASMLRRRVQRVSDREMAAMKAALESPGSPHSGV